MAVQYFLDVCCPQVFAEDDVGNLPRSPGRMYDTEQDELGICKQVFIIFPTCAFTTASRFFSYLTNECETFSFFSPTEKAFKNQGSEKTPGQGKDVHWD